MFHSQRGFSAKFSSNALCSDKRHQGVRIEKMMAIFCATEALATQQNWDQLPIAIFERWIIIEIDDLNRKYYVVLLSHLLNCHLHVFTQVAIRTSDQRELQEGRLYLSVGLMVT